MKNDYDPIMGCVWIFAVPIVIIVIIVTILNPT